jgi:hypothetical protein
VRAGIERIVVAGGDGTLSEVVSGQAQPEGGYREHAQERDAVRVEQIQQIRRVADVSQAPRGAREREPDEQAPGRHLDVALPEIQAEPED